MGKIEIVINNRFYLGASIAANNHPMKSLVDLVGMLSPKPAGDTVIYTVEDEKLFLEGDVTQNIAGMPILNAVVVNAMDGILSFKNYPIYIQTDDADAAVPAWFPRSVKYADDDEEGLNPLQKTFREWVTGQRGHVVYKWDDNGTTRYIAGNFWRLGLDWATLVHAEAGYTLLDKSVAFERLTVEADPE